MNSLFDKHKVILEDFYDEVQREDLTSEEDVKLPCPRAFIELKNVQRYFFTEKEIKKIKYILNNLSFLHNVHIKISIDSRVSDYFNFRELFDVYEEIDEHMQKQQLRSSIRIYFDVTDAVKQKPNLFAKAMTELYNFLKLLYMCIARLERKDFKEHQLSNMILLINGFEQINASYLSSKYFMDRNNLYWSRIFLFMKRLDL